MKIVSLKSLLLLSLLISVHAMGKTLHCVSHTKIHGWNGSRTFDTVQVKSETKGEELVNPMVSGAFEAYILGKVLGKKSQSKNWVKFSGMEDEWCMYTLIIPSDFHERSGQTFRGVMDKVCEGGPKPGSFRLKCLVK